MAGKPKPTDSDFLRDWLRDFENSKSEFETSLVGLGPSELEEIAASNGFRTWRLQRECTAHHGLVLRRFVEQPAFVKLWAAIRASDAKGHGFGFSPANGGVPATILRSVQDWYRLPRFTPRDRRAHDLKIASACDSLLDLLRQVTPSAVGEDRFSSFNNLLPWQAELLFKAFQSPPTLGRRQLRSGTADLNYPRRFAQFVMQEAGITPLSAIESIKAAAAATAPGLTKLPTKLKAKGVMRTYFIHATSDAINNSSGVFISRPAVGNQLLSEIVGLIADVPCDPDDVRKALQKKSED